MHTTPCRTARRRAIANATLALLLGLPLAAAQAQSADFRLQAQPLDQTLTQIASQSGLQLLAPADLTNGLQAPAVQGSLSAEQAANQALAGTGLVARRQGQALVIERAPSQSEIRVLPEVVVTAGTYRPGTTENTGSYTTDSTSAATGLNLSLRETPQSVTVMSRQRLDDQNLNSLSQVLAQVPGLSMTGSSTSSPTSPSATYSRGYMLNRFQIDGGTASPYSFTNSGGGGDGYRGFGTIDTALYDSITVVRGPNGLLSGAGDPSGGINLVRKRPTDSFQASLTASAGRWDQYRAVADIGGPFNDAGTVRGRMVALYDEGKSWMDRYQGDKKVVYGVLDVDLSKATLLSLALEHHHGNYHSGVANASGLPMTFTDGTLTPYSGSDNPTTDWSREVEKKTALSLTLEHRFNDDWRAKVRYGFTDGELDNSVGFVQAVASDGSITSMLASKTVSPIVTRSHEVDVRLDGRYSLWGRQHDLIAGFNGYNSGRKTHQHQLFYSPVPGNALSWDGSYPEFDWPSLPETSTQAKNRQYGFFLSTRLRPTDALSVILGGRLSTWKTRTVNRLTGATTDDRKESSVFTPYAGIVYDLSDSLSAYASYTEIFNPQSAKDVHDNFLDPEEGKNYELGLKGEWFGGRLNASAALFETRKDNLAIRDGENRTPSGGFAYIAASGTKGRGWELEVSGEVANGWQLQGGYTRIVTNDAKGNRLNASIVPKHSFKLFSTWTPSRFSGLSLGGGLLWQSEIYSTNANPDLQRLFSQKSYALVSLMAQYRFTDQLNLSLNLNNAFNKRYHAPAGSYHGYGAPRNLQATLKYQF